MKWNLNPLVGNKDKGEVYAPEVPVFHFRDSDGLGIRECRLIDGLQFFPLSSRSLHVHTG